MKTQKSFDFESKYYIELPFNTFNKISYFYDVDFSNLTHAADGSYCT